MEKYLHRSYFIHLITSCIHKSVSNSLQKYIEFIECPFTTDQYFWPQYGS